MENEAEAQDKQAALEETLFAPLVQEARVWVNSATLTTQCPHCSAYEDYPQNWRGSTVACQDCGHPYNLEEQKEKKFRVYTPARAVLEQPLAAREFKPLRNNPESMKVSVLKTRPRTR